MNASDSPPHSKSNSSSCAIRSFNVGSSTTFRDFPRAKRPLILDIDDAVLLMEKARREGVDELAGEKEYKGEVGVVGMVGERGWERKRSRWGFG